MDRNVLFEALFERIADRRIRSLPWQRFAYQPVTIVR